MTVQKPNALIHESSPYLLQHAYNPVDWQPWNQDVLNRAKAENKLIIISVGYSACHWCHVMEHESFEDHQVANLMNKNFISIKVDREERPDVDQVYMNAAMIINGNGGWPLNAIALPDGRPVYAGTYFPKHQWMNLLEYFSQMYLSEPEKMEKQALRILEGIKSLEIEPPAQGNIFLQKKLLDICWENWKPKVDFEYGGRKGAPKFMMPNQYEYLMRYHFSSKDEEVRNAIEISLEKMACGGLYDTLAGGFTRYSTDAYWKVPHFEKMLYDNAQLLGLYAQAYRYFQKPLYKEIVIGISQWLDNEMAHHEGAFYAAIDADSEGEEGKYYVWKMEEINAVKSDNFEHIIRYFHLSENGNWEHGLNVLHAEESIESYAQRNSIDEITFRNNIQQFKAQLLNLRNRRIRPGLDDKILCDWNALLLKGFCEAYLATGEKLFIKKSENLAAFILEKFSFENNGLYHSWKNGKATIKGFLSDYAAAIEAFIALYKVTFDEKYLIQAYHWMEYCIDHFYDETSGLFYLNADDENNLVARPMETSDNVISSSNSIMARNLLALSHYFEKEILHQMAEQMLQCVLSDAIKTGPFYANWMAVLWEILYSPFELAIRGNTEEYFQTMQKNWHPILLPAFSSAQQTNISWLADKPQQENITYYVCRNKTCQAPVHSMQSVQELTANI